MRRTVTAFPTTVTAIALLFGHHTSTGGSGPVQVDTVPGATVTSDRYLARLQTAIDQAHL
ncbi:MAG: hypothetical protein H7231_10140 [Rhodoferax sp.]|nr:hypothetical protein [Actinomycetota bacterium]